MKSFFEKTPVLKIVFVREISGFCLKKPAGAMAFYKRHTVLMQ